VGVKELKVSIGFTLKIERLGTYLFVTAFVAAMQAAHSTPFGTISGPVAGLS
jgi:hypothetical protein